MQENIPKSGVNTDHTLVETRVRRSASSKVRHPGGMECADVKSPEVCRLLIPEDTQK
jgi:hypothetical protein